MTDSDAQLDLKTTAELLDLPEQAIPRWAQIGALPSRGSATGRPTFERHDVLDWAKNMGMRVPQDTGTAKLEPSVNALATAMRSGRVLEGIGGTTPVEALRALVEAMPDFAELGMRGVDRANFAEELIKREQLAPTAIGQGFAVPHTRKPLGGQIDHCAVVLARLEHAVTWDALDGQEVDTLLLVLSHRLESQLELLRRIAFAMRSPRVRDMLRASSPHGEVCSAIEEIQLD